MRVTSVDLKTLKPRASFKAKIDAPEDFWSYVIEHQDPYLDSKGEIVKLLGKIYTEINNVNEVIKLAHSGSKLQATLSSGKLLTEIPDKYIWLHLLDTVVENFCNPITFDEIFNRVRYSK